MVLDVTLLIAIASLILTAISTSVAVAQTLWQWQERKEKEPVKPDQSHKPFRAKNREKVFRQLLLWLRLASSVSWKLQKAWVYLGSSILGHWLLGYLAYPLSVNTAFSFSIAPDHLNYFAFLTIFYLLIPIIQVSPLVCLTVLFTEGTSVLEKTMKIVILLIAFIGSCINLLFVSLFWYKAGYVPDNTFLFLMVLIISNLVLLGPLISFFMVLDRFREQAASTFHKVLLYSIPWAGLALGGVNRYLLG